jgi:hypothetical protein
MISSRPIEAAIHVAIMRSWRPLGRTFSLGVVGSAILFVAKANPADAPDQKARPVALHGEFVEPMGRGTTGRKWSHRNALRIDSEIRRDPELYTRGSICQKE